MKPATKKLVSTWKSPREVIIQFLTDYYGITNPFAFGKKEESDQESIVSAFAKKFNMHIFEAWYLFTLYLEPSELYGGRFGGVWVVEVEQ